jgi:CheY-like chemotaxis protein
LIVEDDEGIRETLRFALELEQYEVFTAANGHEGLQQLSQIPRPNLILLDLMMPVMNGWEFADALEKDMLLMTIPVVLVTAYGDRADSIRAHGVVKKPVDLDSLLQTVESVCAG